MLSSFAKINLTLDVGALRPDGYHEINSVMQTVSLADTLCFTKLAEGIGVSCSTPGVPSGRDNLAYRALSVISDRLPAGICTNIEKKIPHAAGLGGGSSNAAAALKGADTLYRIGLHEDEMLAAAAEVGSDVPFFILGGTALAAGRGERVSSLPPMPVFWVVLVKPAYEVSTAKIYSLYKEKDVELHTPRFVQALQQGDREGMIKAMGNDLEEFTIGLYPEIASIKQQFLRLGAARAMMAGSGPTVFGLFESKEKALEAAGNMQGGDIYVCRTVPAKDIGQEVISKRGWVK
ncbi:MAG TPA: 4-(cytidine 5'-diphospho)-2-C-methyl-D-erythritol kinase [Peptococcaceae bacterium]|nr:4-(cytidine 5'-diphospho)-2-C-methyl-D-erythritol kinase [Peptococcaceae bacterium]